jgi:phosphatidylinositol alpha-mannosyltransferase
VNILQVCLYDLGRHGGVQRHVLDLAKVLHRHGHSVNIIAAGGASRHIDGVGILVPARARAINVHGTRFEASWVDRKARQVLRRWLADLEFDAVHFHTPWTPALPWQVWHELRARPLRRIATFHDTPPRTASGAIARALFRLASHALSAKLDAAVAVSAAPAAHLRMRGLCPLEIIPPCIDLTSERAISIVRAAREPEPVIAFVGRFEPRKGVEVLLRAFALLRRAGVEARLILCGYGDGMSRARALARRLGVGAHVEFTGALDERDKNDLLERAAVLCAPSIDGESFGLVLIEAMAAGVPVVAAANSGYRSVMNGIGGDALVAPGDSRALADKLMRILDDAALRTKLIAWGKCAAQQADVEVRLPEFLRLYSGESRSNGEAIG